MLRKYKITYVKVETTREQPNQLSVEIEVASEKTVNKRFSHSETARSKESAESRLAQTIGDDYVTVEAYSKYDAKSKFYHKHPEAEIVRVEEVRDNE
jgi:hypothetical protein